MILVELGFQFSVQIVVVKWNWERKLSSKETISINDFHKSMHWRFTLLPHYHITVIYSMHCIISNIRSLYGLQKNLRTKSFKHSFGSTNEKDKHHEKLAPY